MDTQNALFDPNIYPGEYIYIHVIATATCRVNRLDCPFFGLSYSSSARARVSMAETPMP